MRIALKFYNHVIHVLQHGIAMSSLSIQICSTLFIAIMNTVSLKLMYVYHLLLRGSVYKMIKLPFEPQLQFNSQRMPLPELDLMVLL